MRKKVITKPVFGKIFIVRFLVWLVIFTIVAGYKLDMLYDTVLKKEIYGPTNDYRNKIEESAAALLKAEPGSDEYDRRLNRLKASLAFFQTIGYNYAEVQIGDLRLATDEDTAYFYNYVDDQNDTLEYFFIEDISYLDPLNEFLRKNGIKDERQMTDMWYRYGRDPYLSDLLGFNDFNWENLKNVYVNREKHTFLPGVIRLVDNGKEYEIDCTPVDTKGYERIDFDSENVRMLIPLYRVATDLSEKDIDKERVFKIGNSGHIGFSDYKRENVFVIAPFSCALVILIDLVASAIAALIFADIKYHREKTVWEIFDYRVRTTEAMAHDLKTPMSTIMFYLENLEESSEDPEKVREYTKTLNDKVVTMDRMIGDILSFSKGEAGKVELNKEIVSVKELITESLKEFPDMKAEINGDDVILTTDRKLFSQVIMNLLSNCDRYGKVGSVVNISLALKSLTITNKTDKSYDDVESLKKPFVKGDDSRGNKGTGLGLAIADNTLSMLGYKLEMSSESDEFQVSVKFKF